MNNSALGSQTKRLVLDANILIRASLGVRVRAFLESSHQVVQFFSPDVCIEDARHYLPALFEKQGTRDRAAIETLERVLEIVIPGPELLYSRHEETAKRRVESRDPDDWPVVASAIALDRPIWTEDRDFFGIGIATWTSDRVHLFLS